MNLIVRKAALCLVLACIGALPFLARAQYAGQSLGAIKRIDAEEERRLRAFLNEPWQSTENAYVLRELISKRITAGRLLGDANVVAETLEFAIDKFPLDNIWYRNLYAGHLETVGKLEAAVKMRETAMLESRGIANVFLKANYAGLLSRTFRDTERTKITERLVQEIKVSATTYLAQKIPTQSESMVVRALSHAYQIESVLLERQQQIEGAIKSITESERLARRALELTSNADDRQYVLENLATRLSEKANILLSHKRFFEATQVSQSFLELVTEHQINVGFLYLAYGAAARLQTERREFNSAIEILKKYIETR